jgi:hypothetical protein
MDILGLAASSVSNNPEGGISMDSITEIFGSDMVLYAALERANISLEDFEEIEPELGSEVFVLREGSPDNRVLMIRDNSGWEYIRIESPSEGVIKEVIKELVDSHHQSWVDFFSGDRCRRVYGEFTLRGYNGTPLPFMGIFEA